MAGFNNSSQSQNRFAYTQNNPIRYIDPTGHYGWDDFITEAKSLINDPVGHTLAQIQKNRNLPWQCTDVGQIALWAAPAIVPLVIVAAIPIILVSPDSMVDLAFLAYDSYIGDSRAFALDAAALLIPGVTGLGALSRADDAYDLMRYSDEVLSYSDEALAYSDEVVQYSDETVAYADEIAAGDCLFDINSFTADTTVATNKGERPIAQIKIGDFVLAWDEKNGEISFHPVTDTIHHTDKTIVHLTIEGEEITTTPEHPFYVEGKGWVDAKDLQVGDGVRKADGGTGEVEQITAEQTTQEMYNLTVDEAHTFYVGDGHWLVHNACPPRIINKKYSNQTFYPNNPILKQKYPNGVQFDANGFPDFSPYSRNTVKIKMTGDYQKDFKAANELIGIPGSRPPKGYTWHHHQNRTTMQLVPFDLHNAVRHTGGVSLIKSLLGLK